MYSARLSLLYLLYPSSFQRAARYATRRPRDPLTPLPGRAGVGGEHLCGRAGRVVGVSPPRVLGAPARRCAGEVSAGRVKEPERVGSQATRAYGRIPAQSPPRPRGTPGPERWHEDRGRRCEPPHGRPADGGVGGGGRRGDAQCIPSFTETTQPESVFSSTASVRSPSSSSRCLRFALSLKDKKQP